MGNKQYEGNGSGIARLHHRATAWEEASQLKTEDSAVAAVGNVLSEVWVNERRIAETFNVSLPQIRRWRLTGEGPPYYKFGTSVRYKLSESIGWANSKLAH